MAHGLMFHHFHDALHPKGQGAISADELDAMIAHVGRRHILDADDWLERALANRLNPGDLCVTLDDGLRCQFDVAWPVLRAHNIRAFWFVYSSVLEGNSAPLEIYRHFRTTGFADVDEFYAAFFAATAKHHPQRYAQGMDGFDPERYLQDFPFYSRADRIFRHLRDRVLGPKRYHALMGEMIRQSGLDARSLHDLLWMRPEHLRTLDEAGQRIGLHSHTHPTVLAELSPERQEEEYTRNLHHLSGLLAAPPQVMSHPCNSYNAATLIILRRLGIRGGFRSNLQPVAHPGPFEWPRLDHAILRQNMRSGHL
ncbi:MAG: polysaccharide deacetylase family protein [Magnetococcales bacterium]|nr:polysaccharide deacetylase family protein [Magnetococcales bacterium]